MCVQWADKFNPPFTSPHYPSRYQRTLKWLTVGLLLSFLCLFISDWLGLRFNTTHSVDPGFYWVIDKQPEKGDFVSFCPAQDSITQIAYERGYIGFGNCPKHTERLLKIVYGNAGDIIELTDTGVMVNGALLPNSVALTQDGLDRKLVPYQIKRLVLQSNELWVMTNRNPLSFDSRYFGPIRLTQVSDVVKPLWTWR